MLAVEQGCTAQAVSDVNETIDSTTKIRGIFWQARFLDRLAEEEWYNKGKFTDSLRKDLI